MNNIDDTLNNYFEGKSSLEEELALKEYFLGDSVSPEHEMYKPLFAAFSMEKEVKGPVLKLPGVKKQDKSVTPQTRRVVFICLSGIAATLLLLFALQPLKSSRNQNATVVIINGQRITNPLVAQEYAGQKFAEAEALMREYYEPFQAVEKMSRETNAGRIFKKVEEKMK